MEFQPGFYVIQERRHNTRGRFHTDYWLQNHFQHVTEAEARAAQLNEYASNYINNDTYRETYHVVYCHSEQELDEALHLKK